LQLQFFLALLLLLLVADIFADDWLIPSDRADARASRPAMPPGAMPLASQKLPMNTDCRLALEPSDRIGPTVCRGNAQTQMHMIRHRMPLHHLDTLVLAEFAQDTSDTPPQLRIQDTLAVLWDKNYVILAIPADVRLALPFSHGSLLSSERGGSLKGGSYFIWMHDGTAEPLQVSPPEAVAYPV